MVLLTMHLTASWILYLKSQSLNYDYLIIFISILRCLEWRLASEQFFNSFTSLTIHDPTQYGILNTLNFISIYFIRNNKFKFACIFALSIILFSKWKDPYIGAWNFIIVVYTILKVFTNIESYKREIYLLKKKNAIYDIIIRDFVSTNILLLRMDDIDTRMEYYLSNKQFQDTYKAKDLESVNEILTNISIAGKNRNLKQQLSSLFMQKIKKESNKLEDSKYPSQISSKKTRSTDASKTHTFKSQNQTPQQEMQSHQLNNKQLTSPLQPVLQKNQSEIIRPTLHLNKLPSGSNPETLQNKIQIQVRSETNISQFQEEKNKNLSHQQNITNNINSLNINDLQNLQNQNETLDLNQEKQQFPNAEIQNKHQKYLRDRIISIENQNSNMDLSQSLVIRLDQIQNEQQENLQIATNKSKVNDKKNSDNVSDNKLSEEKTALKNSPFKTLVIQPILQQLQTPKKVSAFNQRYKKSLNQSKNEFEMNSMQEIQQDEFGEKISKKFNLNSEDFQSSFQSPSQKEQVSFFGVSDEITSLNRNKQFSNNASISQFQINQNPSHFQFPLIEPKQKSAIKFNLPNTLNNSKYEVENNQNFRISQNQNFATPSANTILTEKNSMNFEDKTLITNEGKQPNIKLDHINKFSIDWKENKKMEGEQDDFKEQNQFNGFQLPQLTWIQQNKTYSFNSQNINDHKKGTKKDNLKNQNINFHKMLQKCYRGEYEDSNKKMKLDIKINLFYLDFVYAIISIEEISNQEQIYNLQRQLFEKEKMLQRMIDTIKKQSSQCISTAISLNNKFISNNDFQRRDFKSLNTITSTPPKKDQQIPNEQRTNTMTLIGFQQSNESKLMQSKKRQINELIYNYNELIKLANNCKEILQNSLSAQHHHQLIKLQTKEISSINIINEINQILKCYQIIKDKKQLNVKFDYTNEIKNHSQQDLITHIYIFRQLLHNLIGNAFQHSKNKKTIKIKVTHINSLVKISIKNTFESHMIQQEDHSKNNLQIQQRKRKDKQISKTQQLPERRQNEAVKEKMGLTASTLLVQQIGPFNQLYFQHRKYYYKVSCFLYQDINILSDQANKDDFLKIFNAANEVKTKCKYNLDTMTSVSDDNNSFEKNMNLLVIERDITKDG